MKTKLVILLSLLFGSLCFAFSSNTIKFQAVLRDINGKTKASENVIIKLDILQVSEAGPIVYSENYTTKTDVAGLFTCEIGSQNQEEFSLINWDSTPYFVRITADNIVMGTSKISAVPFSLYAEKCGLIAGEGISIADNQIVNSNPDQTVSITSSDGSLIVNGEYPNFDILSTSLSSAVKVVNSSNINSIDIRTNDILSIEGIIDLTEACNLFNKRVLIIGSGTINGNNFIIKFGSGSVINGVSFTNCDIDASKVSFNQCSFTGNCPRLGYDCNFQNSIFSNIATSTEYLLGKISDSEIKTCTFPRYSNISNSTVSNCTLGNTSEVSSRNILMGCRISQSFVYSLSSDFIFYSNSCSSSKLFIGNAVKAPSRVTITSNLFDGILSGESEIIQINPTYSGYKLWNINNNSFSIQSTEPQSISISGNDGNTTGYSVLKISSNIFMKGLNSLSYSSTQSVIFKDNTILKTVLPAAISNLKVSNNEVY